jgi:hypothetical protein
MIDYDCTYLKCVAAVAGAEQAHRGVGGVVVATEVDVRVLVVVHSRELIVCLC